MACRRRRLRRPRRRCIRFAGVRRRLPWGGTATRAARERSATRSRRAVREALALLVESESMEDALADRRMSVLDDARRAWRAELERVRRTPPLVGERFALVRFESSAQVHPLVAAQWRQRLAPRVVIAANDGYLPGRVNFAVRGGTGDLRALLRAALPEADGEFAHGHDRATGGSLAPGEFESLLQRLGVRSAAT